jgi:hypothetical protein
MLLVKLFLTLPLPSYQTLKLELKFQLLFSKPEERSVNRFIAKFIVIWAAPEVPAKLQLSKVSRVTRIGTTLSF